MNNKQTQRKPQTSVDYRRLLNERIKQMNPLQIASFGTTLNVLQQIERHERYTLTELQYVTNHITQITELQINAKWYEYELRNKHKQTLRGLIKRNNELHSMLDIYNRDAMNARNALDVLITTIKRG